MLLCLPKAISTAFLIVRQGGGAVSDICEASYNGCKLVIGEMLVGKEGRKSQLMIGMAWTFWEGIEVIR